MIQPLANEAERYVYSNPVPEEGTAPRNVEILSHPVAEALSHPENLPLSHKGEVPESVRIPGGKMFAADPKDHTVIFLAELDKVLEGYTSKGEEELARKVTQVETEMEALHEMGVPGIKEEDLVPTMSGYLVLGGIYIGVQMLTPVMVRLVDVLTTIGDSYRLLSKLEENLKKSSEYRKLGHSYLKTMKQTLETFQKRDVLNLNISKDDVLAQISYCNKRANVIRNKLSNTYSNKASRGQGTFSHKSAWYPKEVEEKNYIRSSRQKKQLLFKKLAMEDAEIAKDPVALSEAILQKMQTVRHPDLLVKAESQIPSLYK